MIKFSRRLASVALTLWALTLTFFVLPPDVRAQVYNFFPPPGITFTPSGGMALGSPTGGVKGAGTLNATGLYVNGTAVSTGGGGGGVSSVALTAPSGFSVTGSPVTSSGTLALGFAGGQAANEFLATPDGTTGAITLRTLVSGDIPATFGNANGITISAPTNVDQSALAVLSEANTPGLVVIGASTTGQSEGVEIIAGTNSVDLPLLIQSTTGTNLLRVWGDGGVLIGASPSGGDEGAGTVNVSGGYYVNGVAVSTVSGTFTATLSGFTTSPTMSCSYSISGLAKTIYCNTPATGTSNSAEFGLSGFPSSMNPTGGTAAVYSNGEDGGSTAWYTVGFSGTTLQFEKCTGIGACGTNAWTASGTKGFSSSFLITYQ